MCGIAGIYNFRNGVNEDSHYNVKKMLNYMYHRGPDDNGIVVNGTSILGQARLSILDTSENGHQPFVCNGVTVAVNGEIYNYKKLRLQLEQLGCLFKSNSDSEVVLHGYITWGEDLPKYLKGMFAFSIYDNRNQTLYLCRDRQGIKPLYYSILSDQVVFASEVGALLSSGLIDKKVNLEALNEYLLLGYIPQTTNLIKNISSLLPGKILKINLTDVNAWQYWERPTVDNTINLDNVVEHTRHLLNESIQTHLQSDVPLGVFLSGGIDSAAVTGLCKQYSKNEVSTFSIGFEDGPSRLNELDIARRVSEWFGTTHNEFIVSGRFISNNIDNFIRHMDMPTFDGINTYIVSEKVRESGFTVALSGLGGDELFGGYNIFRYFPSWVGYLKYWNILPVSFKKLIIHILNLFIKSPYRKSKLNRLLSVNDPLSLYFMVRGNGDAEFNKQLFNEDITNSHSSFTMKYLEEGTSGMNAWQKLQKYEMTNYMSWRLLRDTDAMSMAHSLEVRVPLIDDHIVEYILSLPMGWERKFGWPKKLLTESLSDILPDFILNRPKQGFQLPMNIWMNTDLRPVVEDIFSIKKIKNRGIFCEKKMLKIFSDYKNGEIPYEVIWKFVTLELWMNHHNVSY